MFFIKKEKAKYYLHYKAITKNFSIILFYMANMKVKKKKKDFKNMLQQESLVWVEDRKRTQAYKWILYGIFLSP